MSTEPAAAPEMVNLTIDGKPVRVPKGTNLIEAAKTAGIDIPFYCYHPHLSIAGNCRMCQVKVKGAPKMDIACNTVVREGMEVQTQQSSKEVADTQAAVLEFILINHPLDCTVCDQAGHCKLQDYHYEYNARPSRFLEEKEHKPKAVPLGPTVMLDGERCIMCTRCVRFCDEVTKTSELGMLNRGDRSVIAVNQGRELDNPLSSTVVDLCPVGALTHRNWRFNTRIWFTKETDTICPGCSTGCNARVAVRDREVVQVKGRLNSDVNNEWMCDEGRYGFNRFLPKDRIKDSYVGTGKVSLDDALKEVKKITSGGETLVLVAPDLLTEDYAIIKSFTAKHLKSARVAIAYRERPLTQVEKILISPDYAANFRGAEFSGLVSGDLEKGYNEAVAQLRAGAFKNVVIVGDHALQQSDLDGDLYNNLRKASVSVGILADAHSQFAKALRVVLPARTILERSGLVFNRRGRVQYNDKCVDYPIGSEPVWRIFNKLAELCGAALLNAESDREATLAYLKGEARLSGLTIQTIKAGGVQVMSPTELGTNASQAA